MMITSFNAESVQTQTKVKTGFRPAAVPVNPQPGANPPGAVNYDLFNQTLPAAPNYVFDEKGNVVAVNPGTMPPWMSKLNSGIPGFNCGTATSSKTPSNVLAYGGSSCTGMPMQAYNPSNFGQQNQQQQDPMAAALAQALPKLMGMGGGGGGGGGGGLGGGGGGGGGGDYGTNSNLSQGAGSMNGTQTASVNSGPDSLCTGTTSVQTQQQAPNNESFCKTIEKTILDESKGQFCNPSNAELAEKIGANVNDMNEFCPGWEKFRRSRDARAAFLMNFVAAIVKTESSWNTNTAGDGGKSKGLLQLTVASDRKYGCACNDLQNDADLHNPIKNLKCGTRMILWHMASDSTVGRGDASNPLGIARSFGPFRNGRGEREDIKRRVKDWCDKSYPTLPLQPQGNPGIPNLFSPPAPQTR
jgi:hypothetical protein